MLRSVARLQAKEIRFGMKARASMQKGVTRAVAAVATTLGPKGRNVIIEQAYGAPRVTKDGVTVARAIDFEDRFENMGAQLVKNVCNQTNDLAGDGTTTAAVLVDSIFSEGLKCISRGTNPIDMKRGMDVAVDYILTSLLRQSRPIKGTDDIVRIATISANGDSEIGKMVGEAMEKVGRDGVITTKDGNTMATELEVVEGMKVERGYMSPYLMTDPKTLKAELEDALVLVHAKKINTITTLLPALNYVAQNKRPLLIIADDVEGEALSTIILNKLQGQLKVLCIKAPGFGDTKAGMLEDIALFTGATLLGAEGSNIQLDAEDFDPSILGSVKKVTSGKDESVLMTGGGDAAAVQERVELLRAHILKEPVEYNREKFQERLAKLTGGVAVIKVGGATETEVNEKKDRVVDAVCATRAAVQEGIVPGGGTALLRASLTLEKVLNSEHLSRDQRTGVQIIRNAVRLPAMTIAANAGKEGAVIVERILEQKDETVGYDAAKDCYVNMFEAGIIDPTRVTQVALSDAVSVASLMMTAEAAVVQAPKKKKEANEGRPKGAAEDEDDGELDLSLY